MPGLAGTKQQLQQMYEARQVIQFAEFYPVGHRSTDYPKFFKSSVPYAVKFKTGYEPYILVSRRAMPWYDERFRGYGWDKVRQSACQAQDAGRNASGHPLQLSCQIADEL